MADGDPNTPDTSTPDTSALPPTVAPQMGNQTPQLPPPQSAAISVLNGDPGAQMLQAAATSHARSASVLNAIGTIFGGDTTYHLQQNPDGSVDATPQESTPGEKWGRIAKAALLGAAKGFQVGQGPGGAARAASAGIQTGMALPQAQQDQTMAMADRMTDQNQKRLLQNANIAYLNTRNLESSWALGNNKKLAAEHDEDRDIQFQQTKKQLHLIDVGPADTVEDAAKLYNGNAAVQQAMTGKGGQLYIYHPSSGPPHAYIIPADKLAELNPNDHIGMRYSVDPDTNKVLSQKYTITGGTESGYDAATRQGLETKQLFDAINTSAGATEKEAQAQKARAEANAPPKTEGTLELREDAQGNPIYFNNKTGEITPATGDIFAPGSLQKRQDAQEKLLGSARDSYNFARDYVAAKNHTASGDEAMMEKFFDLAKPSTGFRMTQPQQNMLLQGQSLWNQARASITHKLTPDAPYFSPQQRQQIMETMDNLAASKGLIIRDGTAALPPLTRGRGAPAAAPTGTTVIPEPIAPARPNLPAAAPTAAATGVINGKQGSLDSNSLFTPKDGSTPFYVGTVPGGGIYTFPTLDALNTFKANVAKAQRGAGQ